MQARTEVQLTPVPPKPNCVVWYKGNPCDVLTQQYNQAVQQRAQEEIQLYASRQKAPTAASLQQQMSQLKADVQLLQQRLQEQNASVLVAEAKAHSESIHQGAIAGFSAALLLVALSFGIRKLFSGFTTSKRPQARAASA